MRQASLLVGLRPTIDERKRDVILSYEIRRRDTVRLEKLNEYKIILICDDSGSMKQNVDGTAVTRWDELKVFVGYIVEIVTVFNPHGINIRFLNRQCSRTVTDTSQVGQLFEMPPMGYTPLANVVRDVLPRRDSSQYNEKFLIFIATDGKPTNNDGDPDLEEFQYVMDEERDANNTHVMFLICTDEEEVVEYLRSWDNRLRNVDVTDDYKSQKALIRKKRGANHPFTQADYVVKILVGAIDPEIDFCDDDPEEVIVVRQ